MSSPSINTAAVVPRAESSFFLGPFVSIWRHRRMLLSTLLIELRTTYAGSALGLSWVVISPVLLMSIYAAVYSFVFRVRTENLTPVDYVFHVCIGLTAFFAFAGALGTGTNSVLRNKQLLVNAVFPPEMLPVRAVLVASPPLAVGAVLLVGAELLLGRSGWWNLGLLFVMVLQIMFMCGLAWILSLVTLVLRDIQHLIQYVVMVLLIITPMGYTLDMVPRSLRLMVDLNPVAYFVLAYQSLLVQDSLPGARLLIVMTLMSVALFLFGFWMFQRVKLAFYDYA